MPCAHPLHGRPEPDTFPRFPDSFHWPKEFANDVDDLIVMYARKLYQNPDEAKAPTRPDRIHPEMLEKRDDWRLVDIAGGYIEVK